MKPTQTFDAWMAEVDAQVEALAGCSVRDLPDCLYADWYAAGVSPLSAARRAIRNADNDEDEDESKVANEVGAAGVASTPAPGGQTYEGG
jgi:hypothetical protein